MPKVGKASGSFCAARTPARAEAGPEFETPLVVKLTSNFEIAEALEEFYPHSAIQSYLRPSEQ
jgi:hypothetical protein